MRGCLLSLVSRHDLRVVQGCSDSPPCAHCVAAVKAALALNVQDNVPPVAQGRLLREETANAVCELLWTVGAPASPSEMVDEALPLPDSLKEEESADGGVGVDKGAPLRVLVCF